ncbi:hypothetical protein M758_UG026400 [Ceratodon purpureus]|nr:hypothetical protein M758_UG026400 [Ceratodon purpureus]
MSEGITSSRPYQFHTPARPLRHPGTMQTRYSRSLQYYQIRSLRRIQRVPADYSLLQIGTPRYPRIAHRSCTISILNLAAITASKVPQICRKPSVFATVVVSDA